MKTQLLLLVVIGLTTVLSFCNLVAQPLPRGDANPNRSTHGGGGHHNFEMDHPLNVNESIEQIQSAGMWDTSLKSFVNYIDGAEVSAMVAVGDTLYMAGDFHYVDTLECWHIVRYNRRTKAFSKVGNGFDRPVRTLAWHNGKLYAGGSFTRPGFFQTTSLNYLAVFDGASWTQVGGGVNNAVHAMAFVRDTLYVGGYFSEAGGQGISYLAAWDGSTWIDESNGLNDGVTALYAVGDSLFIGGDFNISSLNLRRVCLLYHGTLSPLGAGLDSYPSSFALLHDTLWVGGNFYWTGDLGQQLMCIGAWDGSNWNPVRIDTNYGTGSGDVNQVTAIGDTLYVLGDFGNIAGIPATGIARYVRGGWSALPSDLYGSGNVAVSLDNKLWVGGRFTKAGSITTNGLATFDGNVWQRPVPGRSLRDGFGTLSVNAVAADRKYIYFGGVFTKIGNAYVSHIAAWDKLNHTWTSVGDGVDGDVESIAIYGTDVYVGGGFYHAGGVRSQNIARWSETTQTWYSMGSRAVRTVRAIAVDGSGVFADVDIQLNGNQENTYIARWDGTNWNRIDGGIDGFIEGMAVSNGSVYIGGNIYSIDGTRVNDIAYFDGIGWNQMGQGFNSDVLTVAFYKGSAYAGGAFTNSGTTQLSGIGIWDGSSWQPLGDGLSASGTTPEVFSMAAAPDRLYVSGYFTGAGSTSVANVAQWNGTVWSDESSGTDGGVVYGIAYDSSQDAIAIVGGFTSVNAGTLLSHRFGIFYPLPAAVENTSHAGSISLSNDPNPCTNKTTFHLLLGKRSSVRLEVFDELGKSVAILGNGFLEPGSHGLLFDTEKLPSGVYLAVLTTDGSILTRKLILEH